MADKDEQIKHLWEIVEALSQQTDDLRGLIETLRGEKKDLDIENAGWLKIYQRLQSESVVLKAEISRLQSQPSDRQVEFQSRPDGVQEQ